MALILRKCGKDGHSRYNFHYGNTNDFVTAPDWNPAPICGNGLHGLKEGNGDWGLLDGDNWLVIDADDKDIVDIDKGKCKFRTGLIVFRGTTQELRKSEFPNKLNLNSISAYQWAFHIGNHDVMINKITDSQSAYYWATYIGNRDIMIHKIKNSYYAYLWAKTFGNQDVMINRITESAYAYLWARDIGNQNVMKPKMINSIWIKEWNESFPDNLIE